MSTYKLYFFNSQGRAEKIRILFAQAGVKYEDIRFERRECMGYKIQEAPFGLCPYLEVDGTKISGSINIMMYLGEKFGMAGENALGNAVLGGASDYIADVGAYFGKIYSAPPSERALIEAEFKDKVIPEMFPVIQKHIKDGHVIGSNGKLSWVDIQAYVLFDVVSTSYGVNLADYPELKKLVDLVESQPNIKKWIETRPAED